MKYIRKLFAVPWIAFLLLITVPAMFAGNTGKIAGTVVDKETGRPLFGANIVVEGTDLGAASEEDGSFYILQVPPGTYTVNVTYLGYSDLAMEKVRVMADLTTRIEIEMQRSSIEGQTVTVVAERKMVQKDITSTRQVTSREEVEGIPGFESTEDIFRLYGGTVVEHAPQRLDLARGQQLQVRDESLKNVHIRGGRGGEILYMVDGTPVTHPIYGGRSVLELNTVDISQVELLTGAFSAEYGQAQSGVINITTRSGGSTLESGFEYKTDKVGFLGENRMTDYFSYYLGGPEPITSRLLPFLGVNIPGETHFFFSTNGNITNTAYNNQRSRDDVNILGWELKQRQDNVGNLNLKLDWKTSSNKMSLAYHGSWREWSNFDWLWTEIPDHMAEYGRDNHNFNLKYTRTLSKNTYYNLNFGYLNVQYDASLNGISPDQYWRFYPDSAALAEDTGYDYTNWREQFGNQEPYYYNSWVEPPQPDPLTGFFTGQGYQNYWRNDDTHTYTLRGDLASQVHPAHFIKTGFQVQYHDIRYIDIQDGGVALSPYGRHLYGNASAYPKPPGPYPEFGQNRWVFNAYPTMGSFYFQDKFEREFIILNAGVRMDWFTPGESVFREDWKQQWENATGLSPDWSRLKYKISPRFGISFPIGEETVIFFSYGHFNQLPELQFYYRDPYTGSFTGNPHLDYEQTILYEFGFTHQVARNWAIDIKSYTKDISQQVGTTALRSNLGLPVDLYDNRGYARARGLEFKVNKRYANLTSGRVTYTIQWANGYSSSAFEDYIRSNNNIPFPIRERRLDWDIRHQVILETSLSVPGGRHVKLFGLTLPDNWSINILSRLSSGSPYTPGTTDVIEQQKLENTETGPPTYSTDLKFQKRFSVSDRITVGIFLDMFNIFDQKNVQISYGFNPWTGEPYKTGDTIEDTERYWSKYDIDRLQDPRRFSTGRYTKIGLNISFK